MGREEAPLKNFPVNNDRLLAAVLAGTRLCRRHKAPFFFSLLALISFRTGLYLSRALGPYGGRPLGGRSSP